MTLIEVSVNIGNVLTQIDTILQTPGLSDSDWQTLYALRKHLDDEQRDLIGRSIDEANARYQALTTQLEAATDELTNVIGDITKTAEIINGVAKICSYADGILDVIAGLGK